MIINLGKNLTEQQIKTIVNQTIDKNTVNYLFANQSWEFVVTNYRRYVDFYTNLDVNSRSLYINRVYNNILKAIDYCVKNGVVPQCYQTEGRKTDVG